VPAEGIIDPFNLGYFPERNRNLFISASTDQVFDAGVCIVSNVFSTSSLHFTEGSLKVVGLEKAGFSGLFIYAELPQLACQYLDAIRVDRRRLIKFQMTCCL
jgi:hypothetical protein